jgi:hypothetical protein
LDAVIAENLTWPTKYDDGFPYSEAPNQFWTGFYSSRPTKKKQVRDLGANFRASQKVYALKAIEEGVT